MKLSTALLFISAASAANAANIRGATTTNDRKLDSGDDAPADTDSIFLEEQEEQIDIILEQPLEYKIMIDDLDYIMDESPNCVPGQMVSKQMTSDLTNALYIQVLEETRKSAKLPNAAERATKAKENKGKISTFKLSGEMDADDAMSKGTLFPSLYNENPATPRLCSIANLDFGANTSDTTKLVINLQYADMQRMADRRRPVDPNRFKEEVDAAESEAAVAEFTTELDALRVPTPN